MELQEHMMVAKPRAQEYIEDKDFIDHMAAELNRRYELYIVNAKKQINRELSIIDDRYNFYLDRAKKIKRIKNYKRLG